MAEAREREDRKTEEAAQRRRRDNTTIDGSQRLKLAIPPEVAARLEAEGKSPRWINDEGNRIHNMTVGDDYDRVDGVEPKVVGTSKDGKPIKAYLHAKRKDFIAEDRRKADEPRKATEAALLRGKNPSDPIAADGAFYADEANSFRRGGTG